MKNLIYPILVILALSIYGCTPSQLAGLSQPNSSGVQLSPSTTQKIESTYEKVDTIAGQVQTIATDVQAVGQTGTALGVPYSGWATIAGAVTAALAGLWLKARGNASSATQAAVTIATAANNEPPVGLTPALSSAIKSIQSTAPAVHDAITSSLANAPTVVPPKSS